MTFGSGPNLVVFDGLGTQEVKRIVLSNVVGGAAMANGAQFENARGEPLGLGLSSNAKPDRFRVEVHPGSKTRVAPVGELDLGTVEEFDVVFRQAMDDGCRDLVLDLRQLSFIDSSGIHLVIRWNSLTEKHGVRFALVQGHQGIRRLFEIVGLLDQLPFVEPADDGHAASA